MQPWHCLRLVCVLNLDAKNPHFAIVARLCPPFFAKSLMQCTLQEVSRLLCKLLWATGCQHQGVQFSGHQTSKYTFKYLRWSSLDQFSGTWLMQAIFTISHRMSCVASWSACFSPLAMKKAGVNISGGVDLCTWINPSLLFPTFCPSLLLPVSQVTAWTSAWACWEICFSFHILPGWGWTSHPFRMSPVTLIPSEAH